ncbi:15917_t:CDS:2, partial [Cetraspora pellucida]
GHGAVYSAEYCGTKIVFKVLEDNNIRTTTNEIKQHMEVNNHENIVKFLGVSDNDSGNYMIVMQYANGGTLRKYLEDKISENNFKILWTELIQIAEQIIFGLQHLHDNNVVHGDLNPSNILVVLNEDQFNRVVIADFGSATKLDDSLISIYGKSFTIEYTDPQFFINEKMIVPTFKSDIYSLGIILWELTSGIRPFPTVENKVSLIRTISRGKREKKIRGIPSSYVKIYKKCWKTNPKKRPGLEKILHEIQQLREAATVINNKLQ